MVKYGSYTLPHVLSVQQQQGRVFQEIPLPGRPFPYRKDRGGMGSRFTVQGEIRPATQLARDQIAALADGTVRILDLEKADLTVLESCFCYQTGPTWTDNTVEAASAGGTPFTLLGASSDYQYFGHREKFNKLQFDLQTLGVYGPPNWEYSKGSGVWGALLLEAFLEDFLGSSLDLTRWQVDYGSYSLANSILSITGGMDFRSLPAFPAYHQSTLRVQPKQTTGELLWFPSWTDSNNYIRVYFYSDGNLYFGVNKGGVFNQHIAEAYPVNSFTIYTIIWTPTYVKLYKNGVVLDTLDGPYQPSIPTTAGQIRINTVLSGGKQFDIDYVRSETSESSDGTKAFSQNGTITLIPPNDWKQDTINGITNKFWLRVNTSAVGTPSTVNQIQLNNVFNCIMLDPSFNETADNYGHLPYSCIFAQVENP